MMGNGDAPLAALWRMVPCVYLPSFTATLGDLFTSPVLSLVAVELSGAGAGAAGMVAAAAGTAAVLTQLPASVIYSRIGPRGTLALGAGISSAATLCAAGCVQAQRFATFVASCALMGCGRALMRMATTAYIRELAPDQLRGRATALSGGVHRFAAVVAPLVGGVAAKRFGMAGPFVLGGLTKLLAACLFLLGPKRNRAAVHDQAAADKAPPAPAGAKSGWLDILLHERRFFAGACLAILLMSVGWLALSLATTPRTLLRGTVMIGLGHGLTSGIQSLTVQDFAGLVSPSDRLSFMGLYQLLTDGVAL